MKTNDVVAVLGALAQETRLEAYRLLVRAGPSGLPAGEIAHRLGVPPPTLSFHLKEMSRAGLIHSSREGRTLRYAPDFARLESVLRFLTEKCCSRPEG